MGKHSVEAESGSDIPEPVIDRGSQGWRLRIWTGQDATSTTPQTPTVRFTRRPLDVAVLGFCLFGLVLIVMSGISGAIESPSSAAPSLVEAILIFGTPPLTLALRYIGRAPRFSRLLFVLFSSVGWFAVAIVLLYLAFGPVAAGRLPLTLIWVAELGYMVGFSVLWAKLKQEGFAKSSRRSVAAEIRSTVPAGLLDTRIHGVPGAGLVDTLSRFGENNVSLGLLGEQITATLLTELLEIPAVHIVHGLKFPGSKAADIDHAVVAGNRIALIDSKLWSSGNYLLDASGRILEDGRMNKRHNSHHPTAVDRMSALFPGAIVRGWIVIHPQDSKGTTAQTQDPSARTRLVTADDLMRELGDWLAEAGDTVNPLVMRDILRQTKW